MTDLSESIRKSVGAGQSYFDSLTMERQKAKAKNWVKNGVALNVRRDSNGEIVGSVYLDLDKPYESEMCEAQRTLAQRYGKGFSLTHD